MIGAYNGVCVEEITKNPIFNYLFSGIIFLAQLYIRDKLAEIKKYNDKKDEQIRELFEGRNEHSDRLTAVETILKERRK